MADEATFTFVFRDEGGAGAGPTTGGGGAGTQPGMPRQPEARPPISPPPRLLPVAQPPGAPETPGDGPGPEPLPERQRPFRAIEGAFSAARAALAAVPGETAKTATKMAALGEETATATSRLAGLSGAAGGVAGALGAAAAVVGVFALTIQSANSKIEELGRFSGALAQARAENAAEEVRSRAERAQRIGPQLAAFAKAQGELGREWRELTDKITGVFLPFTTAVLGGLADVVKVINDLTEVQKTAIRANLEGLKELADETGDKRLDALIEILEDREGKFPQLVEFFGGLSPWAPNPIPGGAPVPRW